MSAKFTPGKWTISPKDYGTIKRPAARLCVVRDSKLIAGITETPHYYATEEEVANAKLIAAAPELLQALENLLERRKELHNATIGNQRHAQDCMFDAIDKAKAAIQLATE